MSIQRHQGNFATFSLISIPHGLFHPVNPFNSFCHIPYIQYALYPLVIILTQLALST